MKKIVRCLTLVMPLLLAGCSKRTPEDDRAGAASAGTSATVPPRPTVPPVLLSATPVAAFADASIDGKTPYDQAAAYEATGQHWLARLVLEKRALGPEGTKRDIELLATICHAQGDDECVETCEERLGRKLKFDAGRGGAAPIDPSEHKEPDTEAARARDLLLKGRVVEARKVLEPKVLDGKASKEEVRLLKTACQEQGDRMCIALCDTKLK